MRDKIKKNAAQQRYQKRYRDRQNKWQRDWYARNKEQEALRKKTQSELDRIGYILARIKSKAKRENKEFNLTREDIIIPEVCPLLDIPLFFGTGKKCVNSPSCDRIDNDKGYVKGNIRFISDRANGMKNNFSIELMERFLKYMKNEI